MARLAPCDALQIRTFVLPAMAAMGTSAVGCSGMAGSAAAMRAEDEQVEALQEVQVGPRATHGSSLLAALCWMAQPMHGPGCVPQRTSAPCCAVACCAQVHFDAEQLLEGPAAGALLKRCFPALAARHTRDPESVIVNLGAMRVEGVPAGFVG